MRESRLAFLEGERVLTVAKLLLVAKTQRLEEGSMKARNDCLCERTREPLRPLRHAASPEVSAASIRLVGCRVLTDPRGLLPVGPSHLRDVYFLLSFTLKPMEPRANNSLLPNPIKIDSWQNHIMC